jgi:RecA/RadA recombinase
MLPFLKKFKREVEKLENVSLQFIPPQKWYSTGNFALNRILSGSYFRAVPEGRLTAFVGPSAAGKSYIVCNVIREAQKEGTHVLVLDSENSLDPKFMGRAGCDTSDEKMTYAQIVTIQDVTAVISEFLGCYEKEYGRFNGEAPKLMIVLDSLGNCLTDSENEKFNKGVQTGDQGQSAKNKKHLLRTLVSRLARCNASFVFTDQVYPADPMAGDGLWAVTNGVKYSASQIALLTKLRLREDSEVVGIRMRVETYKSRFVKPGTKIELEIPYATGLSSTSGLLDRWLDDGVIVKDGYGFIVQLDGKPVKFKKTDLTDEFARKVITTNPVCQKIEKEFDDLETGEMFTADVEPDNSTGQSNVTFHLKPGETIDTETGEIIQSLVEEVKTGLEEIIDVCEKKTEELSNV